MVARPHWVLFRQPARQLSVVESQICPVPQVVSVRQPVTQL